MDPTGRASEAIRQFQKGRANGFLNREKWEITVPATWWISPAEVYVDPAIGFAGDDLRQELESLATEGPSRVYVTFPTYEGLALQIRIDGPIPSDAKPAVVDYVNNIEGGGRLIVNEIEQRVREQGARDARVIAMRRGTVGQDRELINARRVQQVTNTELADDRTQWYTKEGWITLCQ